MHHANFSLLSIAPSRVLLHCPLCNGIFRTYLEFINHVQTIHPVAEQGVILRSHVYASNIVFLANPLSAQHVAPQHASLQRNEGVVVQPTSSLNRNQLTRWCSVPPVNRQQIARRNRVVESSNLTFAYPNETIATQQLMNQLDIPISSNADEIVNIVEEQNGLDLNLRL
ncbi:hypothetical protein P3S67_001914 [Capsicum chacoense]